MNDSRDCWRPGVAEQLGSYVYLLLDPRTGQPFYVGKGVGNRCFAHVEAARTTAADSDADYQKLATIRAIEAAGERVRIDILRHGLTESAALDIETAAIDLLGLDQLTNRVAGHNSQRETVDDINAALGACEAVFAPDHRVVLIRVARLFRRGMDPLDLYEATRKWWRIGARKRQVGSPDAPEFAFAVHAGIARAVFRIREWLPAGPEDVEADPRRQGRWSFVGDRDEHLERLYVPTSVARWLPASAQNPLRFVNCT